MPTWNKRYIDLKVEEMTKQNVYIVGQGNVDRTNKGKADGKITIYPYTIVNLLGKYGDFEAGSGGLADGWAKDGNSTPSLSSGVINSYAQKLYFDNTSGGSTVTIYIELSKFLAVSVSDVLFVRSFLKEKSENTETNNVILEVEWYDSSQTYLSSSLITPTTTTSWGSYYSKVTALANAAYFKIKLYLDVQVGNIGSISIDGLAVYNNTAMGTLPYGLQQYFGLQKWEDLATPNNVTAIDGTVKKGEDWLAELLPYVNGIASLGFTWEGI